MAFRSEILMKLDKKGRALLPAAFRDELPADDRSAFVLYHSPNLTGVVNGNSCTGFDTMLDRLRAEFLGSRGLLSMVLDPDFPRTPFAYVRWTESSTGADSTVALETPLLGNRVDRRMLHLLVDGGGADVERAAEDEGEA